MFLTGISDLNYHPARTDNPISAALIFTGIAREATPISRDLVNVGASAQTVRRMSIAQLKIKNKLGLNAFLNTLP